MLDPRATPKAVKPLLAYRDDRVGRCACSCLLDRGSARLQLCRAPAGGKRMSQGAVRGQRRCPSCSGGGHISPPRLDRPGRVYQPWCHQIEQARNFYGAILPNLGTPSDRDPCGCWMAVWMTPSLPPSPADTVTDRKLTVSGSRQQSWGRRGRKTPSEPGL